MRTINSLADIEAGLTALRKQDPRLDLIAESAGEIPLRRRSADFAGLTQIVTGQLVSVAAAAAIFERVEKAVQPLTAAELSQSPDEVLIKAGLSRPKIRTLRSVAEACSKGLDLEKLALCSAEEAQITLCSIKGIGRWTSDIFLLFCAGHPDIFPSGDLALQTAARDAFDLPDRPSVKDLDRIAEQWAPWRAVAARLLWAWYKVQKDGQKTEPL